MIKTDRILQALKSVDRGDFVTEDTLQYAYEDSPMRIGWNATISAPHMHAYCLEWVKDHLSEGAHVLDVGSGSGYLCAVFHQLVGSSGKVVGVEHIPQLAE